MTMKNLGGIVFLCWRRPHMWVNNKQHPAKYLQWLLFLKITRFIPISTPREKKYGKSTSDFSCQNLDEGDDSLTSLPSDIEVIQKDIVFDKKFFILIRYSQYSESTCVAVTRLLNQKLRFSKWDVLNTSLL